MERVCLTVTRLARLAHEQSQQRWGAAGEGEVENRRELDRALGELLDTMSGRLGPDRVMRLEAVATYIPEHAYRPIRRNVKGAPGPADRSEGAGFARPSLLLPEPEPIDVIAMTPDGPPSWFRWRGTEHHVVSSAGPERIAEEWWQSALRASSRRKMQTNFGESYARAYARFLLGEEDAAGDTTGMDGRGHLFPVRPAPRAPGSAPGNRRPRSSARPATRDYFSICDEQGRWLWMYRVLEQGRWFVHGLWA